MEPRTECLLGEAPLLQLGANTELRLKVSFWRAGNGKEEECSFTVVPSCSRFGKYRSGREGTVVIWKALRSAQGIRQDQRIDTKVPSFNRIEQIGAADLETMDNTFIAHRAEAAIGVPHTTGLGR